MPGRVMLTGATGFVGGAILETLLARDYSVNALVNHDKVETSDPRVTSIPGGLFDSAALDQACKDCEAVIHIVGIIMEKPAKGITFERIHFEGAKNVVDATQRAGIKRYLHMSALGVRPNAASEYHKTKFKAEEYVRSSNLDWTIFRPSMIHGPKGEFTQMEAKWARKQSAPFVAMPYFGAGTMGLGGAGKLQPVYVNDVARAFVDALTMPHTIREVYQIAGPDVMTWPELHRIAAEAIVGHRRPVVSIPAWYAKMIAKIAPSGWLPFNEAQVIMSQEDNTCDLTKFRNEFKFEPAPFEATLKSYANKL